MNTEATQSAVGIKFAKIDAVAMVIRPQPDGALLELLERKLNQAGGIYCSEPAVLDFVGWTDSEADQLLDELPGILKLVSEAGMHCVEVRSALPALEQACDSLGIRHVASESASPAAVVVTENTAAAQTQAEKADVCETETSGSSPEGDHQEIQASLEHREHPESTKPASSQTQRPSEGQANSVVSPNESASEGLASATARPSKIIDKTVRSGQRIYAQGADLIVMGAVSTGAEVIADGNVHVYGVLRGRALAGAKGDPTARIYSTCFEAELVSIAGYYQTFEAGHSAETKGLPTLIQLSEASDGQTPSVCLKPMNIC